MTDHAFRRFLRPGAVATLGLVLAASGTVVSAPAAALAEPAPVRQPTPVGRLGETERAAAEARATGQSVEVGSATTATTRTVANPDGTFTMDVAPRPVRVERDGGWVALDPTLRRNPDGSYSPAATPNDLVLSGGGTDPFALITNGDSELGLRFPSRLPTPTVSGATATYPAVLPGVDLVVTANEQGGFAHALVIKNATAAADPAVRNLTLPLVTRNATVRTQPDGSLAAEDGYGRTVFSAPAPEIWDSGSTPAGARTADASRAGAPERSTPTEPGPGAKRAAVTARVSGDALTLSPDPSLLADPAVRYPLYLDPAWNANSTAPTRNAWTYVDSSRKDNSYWNNSGRARVGYNGWESPYYIGRSYFQFPVASALWGANIISATLQTKSVWSANNSNSFWFTVYRVGVINSSTTWNRQPTRYEELDTRQLAGNWRSDGSENPKQHDFNVLGLIKSAASGKWSTATLGLINDQEGNRDAWRKFQNNPTISITFNSIPRTPDRYATSPSVPCNSNPVGQIGNTSVTFSANLSDPDGAQTQLEGQFSIVNETTGVTVASPKVTVSNNKVASVTLPAGQFTDGQRYAWYVKAYDGKDTSPATPTCRFVFNSRQPAPPAVSSTAYPDGTTGAPVGTAGSFTFTPPAGTDPPISYVYSLNTAPPATVPQSYGPFRGGTLLPAQPDNAATTVSITPRRFGPNILYVYAINGAGNPGPVSSYRFSTDAPTAPAPPGDFTGDGRPDHLSVGTVFRPGAWLYAAADGTGKVETAVQVGTDGPGGAGSTGALVDWTGSTVSPLDLNGDGAQDLLVRLPRSDADGNVHVLPGAGDGSAFDPVDRIRIQLPRVDGEAGNQVVDQIVASPWPSITGSPLPDLYVVVGDVLYLYPPGFPPGAYDSPIVLSTGWTGRTITAAAVGANPALFARTNSTGRLELLTGDTATGTPAGVTGGPVTVYATSGFDSASTPVIDGTDVNRDGRPDLWTNRGHSSVEGRLNTGSNTLAAPVANPTGARGLLRSAMAGAFCLDNKGGASTDRNIIWAYSCNAGTNSQVWQVVGDGTVRIAGKCLDVTGNGTANKTLVQLYTCAGTTGQRWQPGPNGSLVNPSSGRCLDAPTPLGNGAQLYIHDCHGGQNQDWRLDGSGIGLVRSMFAGKCLDNDRGVLANGNRVQIWDCNGGDTSQIWSMLGDGRIRIATYCLDVASYATANKSPVHLYACQAGAATNQEWRIGPNFSLVNPVSGRCLDVPGSDTTNGTGLWIHDCNGTNAQRWMPST
ncbi:ricin-type beta-trefoil lectin domain protein [Micromonospora sp. WMMD1102]|uniref:ricin-type beta-trefoil lectin domain protein n=1 Tax=Micromonospora sp. WMMD1102 TaxID=3016105 RepID=UPI002414EA7D|nr:ricin-type beta-trefoil lectin domain protein [Micromonospora sp. WMMD1102]MDG4785250.1 ricin-type beta-trefoil lectin domain protein [Micromonospora sp. WMMD1102]